MISHEGARGRWGGVRHARAMTEPDLDVQFDDWLFVMVSNEQSRPVLGGRQQFLPRNGRRFNDGLHRRSIARL